MFNLIIGPITFFVGLIIGSIFFSPTQISKPMSDFIVEYSGFLSFLATLVLVFITYMYVKLTSKLVSAQTAPRLMINIEMVLGSGGRPKIQLILQNAGQSPAYNIKFHINPENYEYENGNRVIDLEKIRTGIPFLGSGQRTTLYYGEASSLRQTDELVDINVEFNDEGNKKYNVLHRINFRMADKDYTLRDIAGALGEIGSEISMLSLAMRSVINSINQLNQSK